MFLNRLKQLARLARRALAAVGGPSQREEPLSEAVVVALGMKDQSPISLPTSPLLMTLVQDVCTRRGPASEQIFALGGQMLPCWLDGDLSPSDPWLVAADYYPRYYCLFEAAGEQRPSLNLLEIGVRTGYQAVVFAKAVRRPCTYVGIDPDLYRADGLKRARASLRALRGQGHPLTFKCLRGYSNNPTVRRRVRGLAPFDLIHIDGDHSLRGKLIDLDFARTVLREDGLVLVDDFDHLPDVVQPAVARAVRLGWYRHFARLPTTRGLALLTP